MKLAGLRHDVHEASKERQRLQKAACKSMQKLCCLPLTVFDDV